MRTRIDIDKALSRAILREIGERLQACLEEDELTQSLRVQLDRLRQLDGHSPRTTRDHPPRH
jgi:hypothetical protein